MLVDIGNRLWRSELGWVWFLDLDPEEERKLAELVQRFEV